MKKEKLTLEHIAPYLPYGLFVMSNLGSKFILDINSTMGGKIEKREIYFILSNQYLPILHPLSDLTKEITVNGETFVPCGKMITHGFHHSFWWENEKFIYKHIYYHDFQLLISWHFDVFGLISKGLAVDINTIEP